MFTKLLALLLITQSPSQADFRNLKKNETNTKPNICKNITILLPDISGNITDKINGEFCFNSNFTKLISKNCEKNCKLKHLLKNSTKKIKYSKMGTPGSWLCSSVEGKSLGVYPMYEGEKHLIHICKLGEDVISSEYLGNFL